MNVVKILKKIGVIGKIWKKAGVKVSRDPTEKSVNFSVLATYDIQLSLFFGEVDQQTKLVPLVKKCLFSPKKNAGKLHFLTKFSSFLTPNFFRGSMIRSLREEPVKLFVEVLRQRFRLTFTFLLETISGFIIKISLLPTSVNLGRIT